MKVSIALIFLPALLVILGVGCQANGGGTTQKSDVDGAETSSAAGEMNTAASESETTAKAAAKAAVEVQDPVRAREAAVDLRIDHLVKVQGPLAGLDVAAHAFPPVVTDSKQHKDAWWKNDCLRCHETGVGDAPKIVHRDLPQILLTAQCRTCHVQVKGAKPSVKVTHDPRFDANAFPPQIPASVSHPDVWMRDDCLKCHESGLRGAPIVKHEGMPKLLLLSKCRTCHTQVRAVEFRQAPRR